MTKERVKCIIRDRWIVITPEEMVRQAILTHLIEDFKYPKGRFSVETVVKVNGMNKRADALFHDEFGRPLMVIECKRSGITLDQRTISQVAMYNRSLDAPYLLLSNGDSTHVLWIDISNNSIVHLEMIPRIEDL